MSHAINTPILDRPFLMTKSSTTSSRGSHALSKSPFRIRGFKRSQTVPVTSDPPSAAFPRQDGAYPPWPTSQSPSREGTGFPLPQSPYLPPATTPNLLDARPAVDQASSPTSNRVGPLSAQRDDEQRAPRASLSRHRREISVDSKSSYRTSVSSSRYAESVSGVSTSGFSRRPSVGSIHGLKNLPNEPPPLPIKPVTSVHHDSSTNPGASEESMNPPRPNKMEYAGFDFGLPGEPEGRERANAPSTSKNRNPDLPKMDWEHQADAARDLPDRRASPPQQTLRSGEANTTTEGGNGFTLTHFAKALGRENPFHTAVSSTSSTNSSPSDIFSGSSLSSPASETVPNQEQNPSDLTEIDKTLKDLQMNQEPSPKTDVGFNKMTDLKPPSQPDPLPRIPNLPTDPSLEQGGFPLVKRPIVKDPIPRPATASGQSRRCRGCNETIVGKSVSSADGRLTGRYHKACFVCFTCRSPFKTADFYVLNDRPYCAYHYHELNGSLCAGCNHGIEGQYLETQERIGRGPSDFSKFHPDCLRCRTCRIVLQDDYFEWNGAVYCERDARRASSIMVPPLPGARRRPTMPSSPLAAPPGYPHDSPPHGREGRRPSLPMGPGGSSYPRAPQNRIPPPAGARRFPERRTTRLMMIW